MILLEVKEWFKDKAKVLGKYSLKHPFKATGGAMFGYGSGGLAAQLLTGLVVPYAIPFLMVPPALYAIKKEYDHFIGKPRRTFEGEIEGTNPPIAAFIDVDKDNDTESLEFIVEMNPQITQTIFGDDKPHLMNIEKDSRDLHTVYAIPNPTLQTKEGYPVIKAPRSFPITGTVAVGAADGYTRPQIEINSKDMLGRGRFVKVVSVNGEDKENIVPINLVKKFEGHSRFFRPWKLSKRGKAYRETLVEDNLLPFVGIKKDGTEEAGVIRIGQRDHRVQLVNPSEYESIRIHYPYVGGSKTRREIIDNIERDVQTLLPEDKKKFGKTFVDTLRGIPTSDLRKAEKLFTGFKERRAGDMLQEKDEQLAKVKGERDHLQEQLDELNSVI